MKTTILAALLFLSASGAFAQTITTVATSTFPSETVGSPMVSTTTDLNQGGSTTLLPFSSLTGVSVGQVVSGSNIVPGTTVASGVANAQIVRTANGSFAGSQAVIPMAVTTGFANGQQCHDNTLGTVIGDGNVIQSIQAATSITMTSNVGASSGATDSITCDPVVTLSAATTGTDPSGTAIVFYPNATAATIAASGTEAVQGGEAVLGNLMVGGKIISLGGGTTIPTIASGACGAGTNGAVTANSRPSAGNVTIGASATTTCTVVFATTLTSAPWCVIFAANATAAAQGTALAFVSSQTTAQFVITGSVLASTNWNYICL